MRQSQPKLRAAGALALASLLAVFAGNAGAADRYWPPIVDPATGQYTPGRWVWADLVTSDVAAAADFYGKVFGWTFETYGGNDDRETYTLALADGLPIGGMVFDQRAMKGKIPSARWIGLVSVADPKAAAEAVTKSGGTIIYAPTMLGERGETAFFKDPEGTLFGVVRSRNGDPADYVGDMNEWVWLDLWTADVEKATQFYRAVIGYDVLPLEQEGVRSGAHLVSAGYVRAGVMRKHDERSSAVWLPYIRVADVQKTVELARAAGGKVLVKPVPLNHSIAGIIADPTGAPVGIVQLPTGEAQP
jgi:hypothetical protein